jgi:hypothetical protein
MVRTYLNESVCLILGSLELVTLVTITEIVNIVEVLYTVKTTVVPRVNSEGP